MKCTRVRERDGAVLADGNSRSLTSLHVQSRAVASFVCDLAECRPCSLHPYLRRLHSWRDEWDISPLEESIFPPVVTLFSPTNLQCITRVRARKALARRHHFSRWMCQCLESWFDRCIIHMTSSTWENIVRRIPTRLLLYWCPCQIRLHFRDESSVGTSISLRFSNAREWQCCAVHVCSHPRRYRRYMGLVSNGRLLLTHEWERFQRKSCHDLLLPRVFIQLRETLIESSAKEKTPVNI